MALRRLSLISRHLVSNDSLVLYEILPGNVGLITLNRPTKLNALSHEVWDGINKALLALENDPSVHVIVITGAGKAFAAGADITIFQGYGSTKAILKHPLEEWFRVITTIKKPIIAAVKGYCYGGGCELAMMCDMIIAHENAQFGQPEILLGIIPGAGGTQRLPKIIGKVKAMDMVLTGEPISAAEAKSLGLVSRVVNGDLITATLEVARKIAKLSLPALVLAKRAVNASQETNLTEGLRRELDLFDLALGLKDKEEGILARLNKRNPNFKNE